MLKRTRSSNRLPTITIITPSKNQGKFIEQTIQSVLSQSYPNLEYIVIDGGSHDETQEILKKYEKKLLWEEKKRLNQVGAINYGVAHSNGEIIGYLNSDDILEPRALWHVANQFQKHPKKLWLSGDYSIISENGRFRNKEVVLYKKIQRIILKVFPILFPMILGMNNPIAQPSTFWRRSAHSKNAKLRNTLKYTFDYDWWWQLRQKSSPILIHKKLSRFRIHSQSKGMLGYREQFAEQYTVAARYEKNNHILFAQKILNTAIIWIYAHFR